MRFRNPILTALLQSAVFVSSYETPHVCAGNTKHKAAAAVAVARAQVDVANAKPRLPDEGRKYRAQLEEMSAEVEALKASNESLRLAEERTKSDSADELLKLREQLDTVQKASSRESNEFESEREQYESKILHLQENWAPRPPTLIEPVAARPLVSSMAVQFSQSEVISETLPAQLVIGCWPGGTCPAGEHLRKRLIESLTPLGWQIGFKVDDQIRFVEISEQIPCPQVTLYQNGKSIQTWEGFQEPSVLSFALRKAWDSSNAPSRVVAAAGAAGTISGRAQIRQMLDWFNTYVGENVRAEVRWDRSGAQSFPLLAKGDWSVLALFGKYGHIQMSAVGAKNLPLESIGFGYSIDGDDVSFDLDRITLAGLATKLGPGPEHSIASAGPAPQVSIMTLSTIVWIIRDIWCLLHPTCDLQLGGNVSATAVLAGSALTIDFQQMPSIKLVALFTFQLGVQRVVITESNVHVDFTGSRLVKSRDFRVE